MTIEQLRSMVAPFDVVSKHDGQTATITGFTTNDPFDVGLGLGMNLQTVYFEGGGWCLLRDFLAHWDLPANAD
jgi:hypothetical protein